MAIVNEATSGNAISRKISYTLQSLSQSIMKESCIFKTSKDSQNHCSGERNTPLIVTREMPWICFYILYPKIDIVFFKTGNLFGLKSENIISKEIS